MTDNWISPGKTIGILGGGQLGRMMALAAREMGYKIAVLEPAANSPCGQISDHEVIAAYNDLNGAEELAKLCDVLTYEFENIDSETATWLEQQMYLPQGSDLLAITQDRLHEKRAIESFGVAVAPYRSVETLDELNQAVEDLKLPAVLKTTLGGYDGKGQAVIKEKKDIEKAWEALKESGPFVLESWIDFQCEVSVIVTRSTNGEVAVFPVSENIHKNNILHQSIVPARIQPETEQYAHKLAIHLANSFHLIGTLAVEMFVAKDGEIYINELAPRPHNSGHYTINACETSQFEQHIRAICGWPLASTELLKPAIMVNVLGEHLEEVLKGVSNLPSAHLHLYGKEEARNGRKMGHLTFLTKEENIDGLLAELNASPIWK